MEGCPLPNKKKPPKPNQKKAHPSVVEIPRPKSKAAQSPSVPPPQQQTRQERVNAIVKAVRQQPLNYELFHTADRTPFVTFAINGHRETWPIRSEEFELYIQRQLYRMFGRADKKDAKETIENLAAAAIHDDSSAEHKVFTRIGELDGDIYVDLCDAQWRVTRIGTDGWSVLNNSPVKFIRHAGMLALPEPIKNGDIGDLNRFLNVNESERVLFLATLVGDFHPDGPYVISVIQGEHGSGKTTLSRIRRALVDPSEAPTQTSPRSEHDLQITAGNSWLIVLDNLSHLGWRLSDSLCRLATGGGLRIRKHYRNRSEQIFHSTRPVMITSIESLPSRPDFLDRCVIFHVPRIETANRRTEESFWQEFKEAQPGILGAIFGAVSTALRNIGKVQLDLPPRMADFAHWAVAAERGLGLKPGAFLKAYEANRIKANEVALDASPITEALVTLLQRNGKMLDLDMTELLTQLGKVGDHGTPGWPRSSAELRGNLERIIPNLRAIGITVAFGKHNWKTRRRMVHITQGPSGASGYTKDKKDMKA